MSEDQEFSVKRPNIGNSAALFVSVYVVLLAFFIMLNSMASFHKDRAQETMDRMRHKYNIPKKIVAPEMLENIGAETSATTFFSDLKDIVASQMALDEVQVVESGDRMFIIFPTRLLFAPGQAEVRPEHWKFIERMADSVARWSKGNRIDVEFTIGYEGDMESSPSAAAHLQIARAGSFARTLQAEGVWGKSIAVGVDEHNPNEVHLSFIIRAPQPSEEGE